MKEISDFSPHLSCGDIWNYSTCGEISDFSTFFMLRNVKLLHMWRNFRFLHICHVKLIHMWWNFRFLHICHKFQFSPHLSWIWNLSTWQICSPRVPPVVPVTNMRYVWHHVENSQEKEALKGSHSYSRSTSDRSFAITTLQQKGLQQNSCFSISNSNRLSRLQESQFCCRCTASSQMIPLDKTSSSSLPLKWKKIKNNNTHKLQIFPV